MSDPRWLVFSTLYFGPTRVSSILTLTGPLILVKSTGSWSVVCCRIRRIFRLVLVILPSLKKLAVDPVSTVAL